MKFPLSFIITCSATILSASSAISSTILLDSFNSGDFALDFNGLTRDYDSSIGTDFEIRDVRGEGAAFWSAFLDSKAGVFNYTVRLRGTPGRTDFFELQYAKQFVSLNFLGVDAFVLNINGLTGSGELRAVFGGDANFAASLPITGTGEQVFAFADLFPRGWPVNSGGLLIRLVPTSPDFSITLSEIKLIPEPGSVILLASIAGACALRRQRLNSALNS